MDLMMIVTGYHRERSDITHTGLARGQKNSEPLKMFKVNRNLVQVFRGFEFWKHLLSRVRLLPTPISRDLHRKIAAALLPVSRWPPWRVYVMQLMLLSCTLSCLSLLSPLPIGTGPAVTRAEAMIEA